MRTKKSQVVAHVTAGRYKQALAICKCWSLPITSEESSILRRGYECMINPKFYKELGYDPEEQIDKAIKILKRVYLEV